jgi:CheY-like chemotaxis protein
VFSVKAADAVCSLLETEGTPMNLLVIDHELEGTSGIELAEALGNHEGLNSLPLLLLTRATSAQLKAGGVLRVLTRPVSSAELAEVLSSLGTGPGSSRAMAPILSPPPRRSLSLLLAEDNAINARLARRLLERLGHRVTHVTDGVQAVDAVARGSWDAVLMDMQMPLLDGLDATRRIRRAEEGTPRHLPIVALTANAMKGDDQICLAAGMDAYLTKPIDLDRMTRVLDELMASRAA